MLALAPTWMNLEDVMLRERSQTQKDERCETPIYRRPLNASKSQTQRVDGGARGQGLGEGRGYGFMGTESQFGKMQKFRRRMVVMSAIRVHVLNATEPRTYKGSQR